MSNWFKEAVRANMNLVDKESYDLVRNELNYSRDENLKLLQTLTEQAAEIQKLSGEIVELESEVCAGNTMISDLTSKIVELEQIKKKNIKKEDEE